MAETTGKEKRRKRNRQVTFSHRHLSNIDCLMAHTACHVCIFSTVNGHSKKRKKKG